MSARIEIGLLIDCLLGEFTIGNIMEILPFQDPIVLLEMDGKTLWTALESALEPWPAQEG